MNQANRPTLRKSPALAGFLSMLPGAGQAYVGYYLSGFINIAVVGGIISLLSSNSVRGVEPLFGLFLTFFWIFNIIDAVRKAKLYNLHAYGEREAPVPTDSPLLGGIALVVIGTILTLSITLNLDLDWLEEVWPLFVLGLGVYLLWKYRQTRRDLENGRAQAQYRTPGSVFDSAPHPSQTPPPPPHPVAEPSSAEPDSESDRHDA
ncbi:MAG: hypothetical protein R3E12_19140 [Candidatus Eisenbacteria bacterium]|uniref:DUF5668 domain-containing protein n=1 Tax=Eiseniibacteriota bacterium TaxID=2212470 RepID=A0A956RQF9_UNCEI|nr:hypothetical protein [Candidatus Eisenbacteria bacterium]